MLRCCNCCTAAAVAGAGGAVVVGAGAADDARERHWEREKEKENEREKEPDPAFFSCLSCASMQDDDLFNRLEVRGSRFDVRGSRERELKRPAARAGQARQAKGHRQRRRQRQGEKQYEGISDRDFHIRSALNIGALLGAGAGAASLFSIRSIILGSPA